MCVWLVRCANWRQPSVAAGRGVATHLLLAGLHLLLRLGAEVEAGRRAGREAERRLGVSGTVGGRRAEREGGRLAVVERIRDRTDVIYSCEN